LQGGHLFEHGQVFEQSRFVLSDLPSAHFDFPEYPDCCVSHAVDGVDPNIKRLELVSPGPMCADRLLFVARPTTLLNIKLDPIGPKLGC
jgi:hypothetical protein